MKNIKDWGIGLGVAGMSIVSASGVLPNLQNCVGSCGSCGGACIVPLVGIGTVGAISYISKNLRKKDQKA